MKLLIVDTDGVGLSFAWRAVEAGHQVRWFLDNKPSINKATGDGFKGIEKVDNWVPSVKWADLIISTSNDKYVDKLEAFRKRGFPVFGPSVASANLEISRKDGMKIMEKVGIEAAPYETFKTMADAKKHVEKTDGHWVFKTLGDNEDKALTYVSKHAADMINWMDKIIKQGQMPKGEVMLQQFISGIELGVSRFMGTKGFVGQFNESFEHKKLMSSNYGPNTGEMGTIAYFTPESKIGDETLGKLESELVRLGHTGDIAIGFMVDESGKPWPTEFTCRFGWPIANMMLGATEGDPISWMKDALCGKDTTTFKEDIGCCLVLAHADFPNSQKTLDELSGYPIHGVSKGNKKHLHPQSIKIDVMPDWDGNKTINRPIWNSSGDYLVVITGFGKDVKQAANRAYKTADQLHVANPILRDDIGEKLEETLPKLHEMGYATHVNFEAKKNG